MITKEKIEKLTEISSFRDLLQSYIGAHPSEMINTLQNDRKDLISARKSGSIFSKKTVIDEKKKLSDLEKLSDNEFMNSTYYSPPIIVPVDVISNNQIKVILNLLKGEYHQKLRKLPNILGFRTINHENILLLEQKLKENTKLKNIDITLNRLKAIEDCQENIILFTEECKEEREKEIWELFKIDKLIKAYKQIIPYFTE